VNLLGKIGASLGAIANAVFRPRAVLGIGIRNHYHVECFGPDGRLKWEDHADNLVMDVGLDEFLQRIWKSSAFTAADFIGLTDDAPSIVAGDTMASHVGWVEAQGYDEGTREAYVLGAVAAESVDNSASKASFAINATDTIGGCFACDESTKGGTSGILLGAAAFSGGDKAVANLDTLNVTVTSTAASP
jgi:hypothetical protein